MLDFSHLLDRNRAWICIEQAQSRQLRFLGHILRMPEDEPAGLKALYVPQHGRRRPGRQRTSYLKYIQQLLKTSPLIEPCRGQKRMVEACSRLLRSRAMMHVHFSKELPHVKQFKQIPETVTSHLRADGEAGIAALNLAQWDLGQQQ